MTRDHAAEDDFDPETEALRHGLRSRADLVTITRPPIPAVRQRARKQRTRRGILQGLSVVVATCGVAAGVVAWSPASDTSTSPTPSAMGPAPTPTPMPTHTTTTAPKPTPTPTPSTPTQTTPFTSGLLLASDLGAGWTGPEGSMGLADLDVAGGECQNYQPQVPVAPPVNYDYMAPGGDQRHTVVEIVYTFAPGTGPTVMAKVRTALQAGCGHPKYIKLLATPQSVADEAIVYTSGEPSRFILVRSGDRVAVLIVDIPPTGQQGTLWLDEVTQHMAVRLVGG